MPRVLGLTTSKFDPASRVRFIQFIPHLRRLGWDVVHRPNVPDRQWSSDLKGRVPRAVHHRVGRLLMKYNRLRDINEAGTADVVFVNRDLAGSGLFFERRLLRTNPAVIFDFDDAIFLSKNEPAVQWMCRNAAHVTPGNEYLASYARRYSDRVTVIPTVIDVERILVKDAAERAPSVPRVGWSGSDQSIRYGLFPYLAILAEVQRAVPFELVVVTNTRPQLPVNGIRWSFVPWSEEQEAVLASQMDIGIMPLADDDFQRGKCGLKLLQYMAAGLATVASPIGVNAQITEHGVSGFSASTNQEWVEALSILLRSPELRVRMGRAGRERCVRDYSIQTWLGKVDYLLRSVAASAKAAGQLGVPVVNPTLN